jgi:hypothetical protein
MKRNQIIALAIAGFVVLLLIGIIAVALIITVINNNNAANKANTNNNITDTRLEGTPDQDDTDNSSSSNSSDDSDDSDSSDNQAKSSGYACSVLTEDIAADILQTEVTVSDSSEETCTYTNADEGFTNFGVLTAQFTTKDAATSFEYAKSLSKDGVETVSLGSGSQAYWNPDIAQLNILKNNNWVIIMIISAKYEDSKEPSIEVGKQVVRNM